jgi:ABC-type bacteriocin/lantibiotic exporter with double-glycine peptidase domain
MARVECCPQLDAMDCGPASLKMIAAYYGKEYSIQTLRDYCHITREGVSMQGINEAAERVNGGSVFIFELKDLEVIEISYTFALWNKTRRICQGVRERKAKRASII